MSNLDEISHGIWLLSGASDSRDESAFRAALDWAVAERDKEWQRLTGLTPKDLADELAALAASEKGA